MIFEPTFAANAKITDLKVNGQKVAFQVEKKGDVQILKAEIISDIITQ